jgi:hypothetical protein
MRLFQQSRGSRPVCVFSGFHNECSAARTSTGAIEEIVQQFRLARTTTNRDCH